MDVSCTLNQVLIDFEAPIIIPRRMNAMAYKLVTRGLGFPWDDLGHSHTAAILETGGSTVQNKMNEVKNARARDSVNGKLSN